MPSGSLASSRSRTSLKNGDAPRRSLSQVAAASLVLQQPSNVTDQHRHSHSNQSSVHSAGEGHRRCGGSLYNLCNFDPPKPKPQHRLSKKTNKKSQVTKEAIEPEMEDEIVVAPPVPAPLEDQIILLPVMHYLGSPPQGGVPSWATLANTARTLHTAMQGACSEHPKLLYDQRTLQRRLPAGSKLVLQENFLHTDCWKRHDLKGKMHEVQPSILRSQHPAMSMPCHVLALKPIEPPEEFIFDMERHRKLRAVEFSWCADGSASAHVQLCKYLKQREAAPPVAEACLAASSNIQNFGFGNGWKYIRLDLDWVVRSYSCHCGGVEADTILSAELASSQNLSKRSSQPFAHDTCDGVRYLKITELNGCVAIAHLRAFE